jgi:photosystem II stability/assembly factor-like uncharacterized protein
LVNPLQTDLGARPLWKSRDGGATWTAVDGLPLAFPQTLAVAPDGLYGATGDVGMAKSTDAGATWMKINHGITGTSLKALAADPQHPGTLFAGNTSAPGMLYRTMDGGANWADVDSLATASPAEVLVDGQNSQNVYTLWTDSEIRKSTDGGATWAKTTYPGSVLASLAIDPAVSGNLWGYTNFVFTGGGFSGNSIPPYLWHTADGGATWERLTSPAPVLEGPILIDPSTKPSTIYIATDWRSDDGGATWVALPRSVVTTGNVGPVAVGSGGTLYAVVYNDAIYVSHDRGETWAAVGSPVFLATALVPTSDPSTLYALARNGQTAGFLTKLSPDGATILFSTLLGGHVSFGPQSISLAEPMGMTWQNGIAALALDREGDVVVAGATRAADFPLAGEIRNGQGACPTTGAADAFVATIAGDGSRLRSVECIGGSQDDGALAVAADPHGGVVFAGQTWSPDFPVSPAVPPFVGFGDAFVVRMGGAEPLRRRATP